MQPEPRLLPYIIAMMGVVALSNYLVQFPVQADVWDVNLADILTYGAFSYPLAFLVNDLTNRKFGPRMAGFVVICGFALAVVLSIWLATPRIAIASGVAFLTAQLLDVTVFNAMRRRAWWQAPLVSSATGSLIDTVIFFSLAFAASFSFMGAGDAFAIGTAPLLGVINIEVTRWVSWALGDLAVKLLVAVLVLPPYKILRRLLAPEDFTSISRQRV
jgi:uncharacterized PurR-regulated membrane protein YhhQ (DUF165 family)